MLVKPTQERHSIELTQINVHCNSHVLIYVHIKQIQLSNLTAQPTIQNAECYWQAKLAFQHKLYVQVMMFQLLPLLIDTLIVLQ